MFVRMLFSVTTAELFGEFTDINYRICTKKATQKITAHRGPSRANYFDQYHFLA